MGLLLSILVACVGVVELLAFYSNVTRNFITTSTNTKLSDLSKRYREEFEKHKKNRQSRESANEKTAPNYNLQVTSKDIETEFENSDLKAKSRSPFPGRFLHTEKTDRSISSLSRQYDKTDDDVNHLPKFIVEAKNKEETHQKQFIIKNENNEGETLSLPLPKQFIVSEKVEIKPETEKVSEVVSETLVSFSQTQKFAQSTLTGKVEIATGTPIATQFIEAEIVEDKVKIGYEVPLLSSGLFTERGKIEVAIQSTPTVDVATEASIFSPEERAATNKIETIVADIPIVSSTQFTEITKTGLVAASTSVPTIGETPKPLPKQSTETNKVNFVTETSEVLCGQFTEIEEAEVAEAFLPKKSTTNKVGILSETPVVLHEQVTEAQRVQVLAQTLFIPPHLIVTENVNVIIETPVVSSVEFTEKGNKKTEIVADTAEAALQKESSTTNKIQNFPETPLATEAQKIEVVAQTATPPPKELTENVNFVTETPVASLAREFFTTNEVEIAPETPVVFREQIIEVQNTEIVTQTRTPPPQQLIVTEKVNLVTETPIVSCVQFAEADNKVEIVADTPAVSFGQFTETDKTEVAEVTSESSTTTRLEIVPEIPVVSDEQITEAQNIEVVAQTSIPRQLIVTENENFIIETPTVTCIEFAEVEKNKLEVVGDTPVVSCEQFSETENIERVEACLPKEFSTTDKLEIVTETLVVSTERIEEDVAKAHSLPSNQLSATEVIENAGNSSSRSPSPTLRVYEEEVVFRRSPSPYPSLILPVPRNTIYNELLDNPIISVAEVDEEAISRSPTPQKVDHILEPHDNTTFYSSNQILVVPSRPRSHSADDIHKQESSTSNENSKCEFTLKDLEKSTEINDDGIKEFDEHFLDSLDGVKKKRGSRRSRKKKTSTQSNHTETKAHF